MTFVADASALLALILGEPGWEFVRQRVSSAIVNSANFAEVVDVAWRRATLHPDFVERQLRIAGARVTPDRFWADLAQFGLEPEVVLIR